MPGSDTKLRSVAQRFAKITRAEIKGQNVKIFGSWLNNAIIYLNNNNRLPADVIPLIVKSTEMEYTKAAYTTNTHTNTEMEYTKAAKQRDENIPTMNTTQELPNGRRDNKECTKAEKSNERANTSNHPLSI